jgi:hypothetical protein
VTGKVRATMPREACRKVVLVKQGKTVASARSKSSGKLTLKSKKGPKGKVAVKIKGRVGGGIVCAPAKKSVSARA